MWRPLPFLLRYKPALTLALGLVAPALVLIFSAAHTDKSSRSMNVAMGFVGTLLSSFVPLILPKEVSMLNKRAKRLGHHRYWLAQLKIKQNGVLTGTDTGLVIFDNERLRFEGLRLSSTLPLGWQIEANGPRKGVLFTERTLKSGATIELSILPLGANGLPGPKKDSDSKRFYTEWKAMEPKDYDGPLPTSLQPELRSHHLKVVKERIAFVFALSLLAVLEAVNLWGLSFMPLFLFFFVFAFEIAGFCFYAFGSERKKQALLERQFGI